MGMGASLNLTGWLLPCYTGVAQVPVEPGDSPKRGHHGRQKETG